MACACARELRQGVFDLADYRARWRARGLRLFRQVQRTSAGDRWTCGETKRIALGWLKMVVEAERVAVSVDILRWRLMTPKSRFVVSHGALP